MKLEELINPDPTIGKYNEKFGIAEERMFELNNIIKEGLSRNNNALHDLVKKSGKEGEELNDHVFGSPINFVPYMLKGIEFENEKEVIYGIFKTTETFTMFVLAKSNPKAFAGFMIDKLFDQLSSKKKGETSHD